MFTLPAFLVLREQVSQDIETPLPVDKLQAIEIVARWADTVGSKLGIGPSIRLQTAYAIFHLEARFRI